MLWKTFTFLALKIDTEGSGSSPLRAAVIDQNGSSLLGYNNAKDFSREGKVKLMFFPSIKNNIISWLQIYFWFILRFSYNSGKGNSESSLLNRHYSRILSSLNLIFKEMINRKCIQLIGWILGHL